ncbi:MAG TPA: hypothetical protein VHV53_08140 [Solirubrobacterales bacterium]|jgi:hypothetical protein|nr:hypothetical protein [Solirubrobacterales bacterium]
MSEAAQRPEEHALKAWFLPIALWILGPVVGVVVAQFSDFGHGVRERFFEVCALIQPLFALALFVELVVVLGHVVGKQGATAANRDLARSVLRTNAGLLCVSEGLALFAIAADRASTFLVIAIVIPMFIQVLLLVDCGYHRIGIGRIQRG